jgi:hypothetical protein
VLVPTVCRNVSRIRLADGAASRGGGAGALAVPEQQSAGGTAAPETFAEAASLVQARSLSELESAEAAALPLSQVAAEPVALTDVRWPGRLDMPEAIPLAGPGFIDNWRPGDGPSGGLPRPPTTLPQPLPPLVPEPATLLLMLGGLLMVAARRHRFSPV